MYYPRFNGVIASMLPYTLLLLSSIQSIESFLATVGDDNRVVMLLEPADRTGNATAYGVRVAGEPRTHFLPFQNLTRTTPPLLVFNASYHGLRYVVGLVVSNGTAWSKPVKSVTILTKPLPAEAVFIHDYKPSPETAVVFEIKSTDNNVFTRVNIGYLEGEEWRTMLYRDFFRGKTVFRHWLPGVCYSNITFQLVSEAAFNKSILVRHSPEVHAATRHRMVPDPPLNVSLKILRLSGRAPYGPHSRGARDVPLLEEEQEEVGPQEEVEETDNPVVPGAGEESESATLPSWQVAVPSPAPTEEEFVNAVVPEYEGSSVGPPGPVSPSAPPLLPVLLELRWLPPLPPAALDAFVIHVHRDGNPVETATVGDSTHRFFTELREPGTYKVLVTTLSSSGSCEPRESTRGTGFTFYLSPSGTWFEEPRERPQAVTVRVTGPSTAVVSWAPSTDSRMGILVSVLSLTCAKPSLSQRMESAYCSEENSTSDIVTRLTPGAQYRVVVYHTNGPLVSPASDPVIFEIEPTGVSELTAYPVGPSVVVLGWKRPYHVAFRKYVLEAFFFNPDRLTSEWTTYYQIAATASVAASVRVTDLLPAWFYIFRVTMVTWGEPPGRCCNSSTVSIITGPEAPHITSVDFSGNTLYVRWTYGDIFTDLSHSRLLHWLVVAEGKKGARRRISADVTRTVMKTGLTLPPGDIYNLTVTACTERGRNSSLPHIIRLEPAPPKSLYAVNTTQISVTLLWAAEGVVDYYQVLCTQVGTSRELEAREPQTVHSHVATVSDLLPATAYNCSVTSFSYSSPSVPAYVTVSTNAREMNPSLGTISALAILSILLICLLVLVLLVFRKKHLQAARDCGAGTFVNFASFERDGKLPYNWGKTALKKRKLTSPVQLDDFNAYVKDMGKDSAYKFSLQFEELKSVGLDLSHDAADMPVNRPKNRYTNILPYDFSRVMLVSTHSDEGSDYINANYIPGYKSPREYIATQGPLPETRNHFWKMVLQQKSHIIVMLTQCNERRRVKCDHYWPFTDEPVSYGEITVEMLSEKEYPDWTIRTFRMGNSDEVQDVLHLNYTSWPDHGVPAANAIESVLQFVHIVRQQAVKTKGPIVVHCSAGVGRTGTFIALDRLTQHLRDHEFVDILGLVSEMRSHRLSMVQTEEQYVFIHQCVQLMWRKKKQQSVTSDVIFENVSKS